MKIRIGDTYSKSFPVTDEQIRGFAEYTGDKNPIHLDEQYASETLFKHRIAHGFLVGSFISSVLGNDFPGKSTIYLSQSMRFLKPVFIGDTIKVMVEVLEITDKNWLKLKTDCLNQDDALVIIGEAMVIPPADINFEQKNYL